VIKTRIHVLFPDDPSVNNPDYIQLHNRLQS
ncbi:unnamed protein product, partial [Rotaria sordida]